MPEEKWDVDVCSEPVSEAESPFTEPASEAWDPPMALPSGPVGSRIGPGHCGGGIAKVAGGGETAGIGAFPLTVEPLGGGLSGATGTALPSALLIALTRQKIGVYHP